MAINLFHLTYKHMLPLCCCDSVTLRNPSSTRAHHLQQNTLCLQPPGAGLCYASWGLPNHKCISFDASKLERELQSPSIQWGSQGCYLNKPLISAPESCGTWDRIFLILPTSINPVSAVSFIVPQLLYTTLEELRKTPPRTLVSGTQLTSLLTQTLPCSRYFLSALKTHK